jgi:hypothetical protein
MSITVEQTLDRCEEILNGTDELNKLLHNPEFVQKKMGHLKTAFPGASSSTTLSLVLIQLCSLLGGDEDIRNIIRTRCGTLHRDAIYPFFIMYCSFVVYVEHVKGSLQGAR